MQIYLREVLGSSKLFHQLINAWDGVSVLQGPLVECLVINAMCKVPSFFFTRTTDEAKELEFGLMCPVDHYMSTIHSSTPPFFAKGIVLDQCVRAFQLSSSA